MNTKNKSMITMAQLFIMLFITRMISNLTYSPLIAHSHNMWDYLISAFISFFLMFIIIIPIYKLCFKKLNSDIIDCTYFLFKKFSVIIAIIYAVYFFIVCCHTLYLFNSFVLNAVNPKISIITLSLCVIVTSCYGAYKGIEALVRASGFILILVCLSVIFIVIALFPQIDSLNYTPFMYEGASHVAEGTLLITAKTASIPAIALLAPFLKGNFKNGFIAWNISVYLSVIILITVIVGAMGDYIKTQAFPVYTATNIAEIGMLKRLDSLYLAIWTAGIFIKVSLFLFLISLCIKKCFGQKAGKISILISGALIVIVNISLAGTKQISSVVFNPYAILTATLLTSVIIPIILLFTDSLKKNKQKSKIKFKKIFIVFAVVVITVFNSGCQSAKQIHERLLIQGIGVDKVAENYIVTLQTFDSDSDPIDDESNKAPSIITSTGSSVLDALNLVANQNGKEPLYSQNLMIIIGSDTAKDGIENILDFFVRHYETRPSVNIFISKTSAYDIMHCKTDSDFILTKDIAALSKSSVLSSNVLSSNVLTFVGDLQSEIKDPKTIALDIKGDKQNKTIVADGTAVFNHDKLSGYLNNEQTKGALLVNGKLKNRTEVINVPSIGNVTCTLKDSSSKTNIIPDNKGSFEFNININVNVNIYEIDKNLHTKISHEHLNGIKNTLEQKIKSIAMESIKATLFDYNCDIFNFGKNLLKQHPKQFKQMQNNLKETLLKSNYNINVTVKLKQTGKEGSPI